LEVGTGFRLVVILRQQQYYDDKQTTKPPPNDTDCPHNETKLKQNKSQNSFETVSFQFRFVVRTVLDTHEYSLAKQQQQTTNQPHNGARARIENAEYK